jgi:hypothetical protein
MQPLMAAAATMTGDIRTVRPVGEPWRPLKLRLRGGGAELVADELVGVHRQAHRAAGAAPFEAGVGEDLVDALLLAWMATICEPGTAMAFTPARPCGPRMYFATSRKSRDPAVGAGADEGDVDLHALDRRAGGELHVGERLLDGGLFLRRGGLGGSGMVSVIEMPGPG